MLGMTVACVDTSSTARDRHPNLGSPPKDETGANEGAPTPGASGLAARVDAHLASEGDIATLHDPIDPETMEPEDNAENVETVDHDELVVDHDELIGDSRPTPIPPPPRQTQPHARTGPPPLPVPRSVVVVPPRMTMRVPVMGARSGDLPRVTPPTPTPVVSAPRTGPVVAIPAPSVTMPMARIAMPPGLSDTGEPSHGSEPAAPPEATMPRPRRPSTPPIQEQRAKRSSVPPLPVNAEVFGSHTANVQLGPPPEVVAVIQRELEVGTETPNIVIDQPLEAHLESPTVVDRALGELGDAGSEKRAESMTRELEATTDPAAAAFLAYELGELYERRLADEARAVKAYGRSLSLDSSLRPNLWAIRRVFYRRGLWPNLVKLIGAEVSYARDDLERADLLLEKARVAGHHLGDTDEARTALDEAMRIAPQHQGALLELERIVARTGDTTALLDVWERLADAVEQPVRKISYWLEVARAAAPREYARAQTALEQAASHCGGDVVVAERVARERLRIAEEHGAAVDVTAATDELATLLLGTLGAGGGAGGEDGEATDERPDRATAIRRELVALRRRQAQLAAARRPSDRGGPAAAIAMSPGDRSCSRI